MQALVLLVVRPGAAQVAEDGGNCAACLFECIEVLSQGGGARPASPSPTRSWKSAASSSSRSPRATFFLDPEIILRTETSPSQIHAMEEREPPIYMVSIGRCYRRDAIDATHYPIFHQFEGLAVDRGLTLADLKGMWRDLQFSPGTDRWSL